MASASASTVPELLAAYQRVLDVVSRLGPIILVRSRHPGPGRLRRLRVMPRPRWLLRYFVVRHIDRTLQALVRRYHARGALGLASVSERAEARSVEQFRQSLPPLPARLYTTGFVIAGLVVASFLVDKGGAALVALASTGEKSAQRLPALKTIFDKLGEAVASLNPMSANSAFEALLESGVWVFLLVALVVALDLYVILRPFVAAFRLKRLVFNLGCHLDHLAEVPARWSTPRAVGLYQLEAEVFRGLGSHPPCERPFDLMVPGLAMALPLYVALALADHDLVLGAFVLGVAAARLGWLWRTGWRRSPDRTVPLPPFEVRIPNSGAVAAIRSPYVVAGVLTTAPLLIPLLVLYSLLWLLWSWDLAPFQILAPFLEISTSLLGAYLLLLWACLAMFWYDLNRVLADFGRAYGGILGRWPLAACLAFLLLPLPAAAAVSVYRTAGRVAKAQRLAGLPTTIRSAWLVTLCFMVVFPLALAYLQGQVNRVWRAVGAALPDALWAGGGISGGDVALPGDVDLNGVTAEDADHAGAGPDSTQTANRQSPGYELRPA